jgi:hypothetical protein
MSFGVPIGALPVTYDDKLKTTAHLHWLDRRRIKETAIRKGESFDGIDLPSLKDVLFGRGKINQEHTGNVIMRKIISEYVPEYRVATKPAKGRIPLKVVKRIKQEGGRFLKRDTDNGWWFQVSDEAAREKISMSFRKSNASSVRSSKTDSAQIVSVSKSVGVNIEQNSKRIRTR